MYTWNLLARILEQMATCFFPLGNLLGYLSSSSHGNQRKLLTFFFSHKLKAELSEQVQLFNEGLTFCRIF